MCPRFCKVDQVQCGTLHDLMCRVNVFDFNLVMSIQFPGCFKDILLHTTTSLVVYEVGKVILNNFELEIFMTIRSDSQQWTFENEIQDFVSSITMFVTASNRIWFLWERFCEVFAFDYTKIFTNIALSGLYFVLLLWLVYVIFIYFDSPPLLILKMYLCLDLRFV